MNKITFERDEKPRVIAPELHSQFIEFLGGCIDGGIWVGKDSEIPNYDGIRKDVVDALAEIQPPVVRWPGGCYADMYHWRDGVGPERKQTWNTNFTTWAPEKNEFGTHEFMNFCKRIGAKPWININMLSGTTEEMADWAEYCNREEETDLSKERAENGSPEPFGVEYWGIGNEVWAGGGNYTAQGYVNEYRRYAGAMPRFSHMEMSEDADGRMHPQMKGTPTKLIASGPDGNKPLERVRWTKDVFKALGEYRMPQIWGYDLHLLEYEADGAGDRLWSGGLVPRDLRRHGTGRCDQRAGCPDAGRAGGDSTGRRRGIRPGRPEERGEDGRRRMGQLARIGLCQPAVAMAAVHDARCHHDRDHDGYLPPQL